MTVRPHEDSIVNSNNSPNIYIAFYAPPSHLIPIEGGNGVLTINHLEAEHYVNQSHQENESILINELGTYIILEHI